MLKHLVVLALLFGQDPAPSNLKAPPDIPPAAVEADDRGLEFLEAYVKDKRDRDPLDRAMERFREASRLSPGKPFALAHYHLGLAYGFAEQYKQARVSLDKAIGINPNFHEALLVLGDTYYGMRQYDAALRIYDRAIALQPGVADHHRGKGLAWVRKGDFTQAQASFDRALQMEPRNAFLLGCKQIVDKEIQGPGFKPEYRKESAHFIVASDTSQHYTDLISTHLELIYGKYQSIFPRQAAAKVKSRVLLFSNQKGYLDYGAPANTGGYYMDFTRKLVLFRQHYDQDTLVTLYHEAFHQFLAMYLDDAPQWFNEGLGDYFGAAVYDETTKSFQIGVNRGRLAVIQSALRLAKVQPLSKLMQMTRAEMYAPDTVGVNYAQAWSLVYFFCHYRDGRFAKLLQEYFRTLKKDDEDLQGAYDAVFGKLDMSEVESEWRRYILGLR